MDPTAYLYNDTTVQTWKPLPAKASTQVEINKSLNLLGFEKWENLDPGMLLKFC